MATQETDLLDSAAAVESLKNIVSGRALNRRNFMAAIGAGGAAAGAVLAAGRDALTPEAVYASGPAQTDVLNFALNLEYLEATFYAYVTTGADILASTGVTQGSGAITNPLTAPIAFSGPNAAQITDLFNELYYDELNHVITLRNLLGSLAVKRPAINLQPSVVLNSFTAIGIARLLEDVGVAAYAGAASLLSGANLTYAAQILAVEGFHSGALRLTEIQNPLTTVYITTGSSTFNASATANSSVLTSVFYNAVVPVPGQTVAGPGVSGATILALSGFQFIGTLTAGSTMVTGVQNSAGVAGVTSLAVGQTITGNGIPAGTVINVVGTPAPFTLTLSAPATSSTTGTLTVLINTPITGTTTATSKTVTAVSNIAGLAVGQQITGTQIPSTSAQVPATATVVPVVPVITTITAINTTAPFSLTLSQPAIASATASAMTVSTGTVTISAPAIGSYPVGDVYFAGLDPLDVPVLDPGSAVLASAGPSVGGGFFATSGVATVNAGLPVATPQGLAFARSTSQVLSVLYAGSGITPKPGSTSGGYFPSGVNGLINGV